jgi:hypothetical protein
VVVRNLPLSVFPNVHEGISSLDLIAGGSHSELVNPSILTPVVADSDVTVFTYRIQQEKQI